MRIVFMGTPEFAVSVLDALVRSHEVVAAVSQPDRARDRKGRLLATPVKAFAEQRGIPVLQFERIKNGEEELRKLQADVFVTAAYGQILPESIIDIPEYGTLNVHASLLPKLRGSSPIQSAILSGYDETGVSIMQTDVGMDTGDVLLSEKMPIGDMTAGELSDSLSKLGGELLLKVLKGLLHGTVKRTPQGSNATYCKKISAGDEEIDFGASAREVCNKIRAFSPVPAAYTTLFGERIKLYNARIADGEGAAGEVIKCDRTFGLTVACGSGAVRLISLKPASKKIMTDLEFINGNKIRIGDRFGK